MRSCLASQQHFSLLPKDIRETLGRGLTVLMWSSGLSPAMTEWATYFRGALETWLSWYRTVIKEKLLKCSFIGFFLSGSNCCQETSLLYMPKVMLFQVTLMSKGQP